MIIHALVEVTDGTECKILESIKICSFFKENYMPPFSNYCNLYKERLSQMSKCRQCLVACKTAQSVLESAE
jgi:hypothetical protein